MMFVIVVMSASALIVVVVMMMLMIVVMSASALVIVVVMMFMVVIMSASALVVMVMLMIVVSTAYRAEIFVFFSALLHSFQNLCTVQFFDWSGDDHCILVHFADQSDCFGYFLFGSLRCIGTAQNNRSCIL